MTKTLREVFGKERDEAKIPAEPDTPIPDPLIWLAYVAAAAPTLKLGTCILIVPQRNPLVLAKELATLDQFDTLPSFALGEAGRRRSVRSTRDWSSRPRTTLGETGTPCGPNLH